MLPIAAVAGNFGPIRVVNIAPFGNFYEFNAFANQIGKYVQVEVYDAYTTFIKANPNQVSYPHNGFNALLGVTTTIKGDVEYLTVSDQANNRILCMGILTYLNYVISVLFPNAL